MKCSSSAYFYNIHTNYPQKLWWRESLRLYHYLIIYYWSSIITSDSDRLALEIFEALSKAEEDDDYDYT